MEFHSYVADGIELLYSDEDLLYRKWHWLLVECRQNGNKVFIC